MNRSLFQSVLPGMVVVCLLAVTPGCVTTKAKGVAHARQTQGLVVNPTNGSEHVLVDLKGPGLFISADAAKQGGDTGLTFLTVEVDGKHVIAESFVSYTNVGLLEQNHYGAAVLTSPSHPITTLTVGYPVPLYFERSLRVIAKVDENNVRQIVAKVINGD